MFRVTAFVAAVCLIVAGPVGAGGRSEVAVEIPAPVQAQVSGAGSVYINVVTDNRGFEDRPAEANIPSVAEGVASLTAEKQAHLIGRVRDGYGKGRNNIFSTAEWPVEAIAKKVIEDQLTAMGYAMVADASQADITIDVSIEQLWGFILVQGGGWGGSAPKMAGEIKTTLTTQGPGDRTGRFEVTGEATHKFGLMTAKHWSIMFSELLTDYMKNLATLSF